MQSYEQNSVPEEVYFHGKIPAFDTRAVTFFIYSQSKNETTGNEAELPVGNISWSLVAVLLVLDRIIFMD